MTDHPLRLLRLHLGLSLERMAPEIGRNISNLSRIENRKHGCNAELAEAILRRYPRQCKRLGIDFEALVRGRRKSAGPSPERARELVRGRS